MTPELRCVQPRAGKHCRRSRQARTAHHSVRTKQGCGDTEGVDGSPAVLHRQRCGRRARGDRPRDARGNVVDPSMVISVNEPHDHGGRSSTLYEGVRVQCAAAGEDYSIGQIVAIPGAGPTSPAVPADAVTASGSGLDLHISPAYAELQAPRTPRSAMHGSRRFASSSRPTPTAVNSGFLGEPQVNVVELNIALDRQFPVSR